MLDGRANEVVQGDHQLAASKVTSPAVRIEEPLLCYEETAAGPTPCEDAKDHEPATLLPPHAKIARMRRHPNEPVPAYAGISMKVGHA